MFGSLRGNIGSLFGTNEDDVLAYDSSYKHVDGGPGIDTLVVPPATTLDLFDHVLFGIENLNLSGQASTVVLNAQEIMRLTAAPHTFQVTGLAGDAVYAGDGWSYDGVSGNNAIYTNQQATLIVDTNVRRSGIVDHAPDAQADRTLTVKQDSGAAPLAIAAPTEIDGDALAVVVTSVPNPTVGSVFLGDSDGGSAVVRGQTLSAGQLEQLVFAPVEHMSGSAGAFGYTVSDQGTSLGLSDTQTLTIDVTAAATGRHLLDHVPAYSWYHGCGPTAVASILGYWDLLGYENYFGASGWDQVRYTANVQDEISSPAHNAKYDPTPDNASLPVPSMTSIADFLHTSQDPLGYGWTYLSEIAPGMEAYANSRGEPLDAWSVSFDSATWQALVREIDAGRPSVFLVDTNGDAVTDHFVPVLGYEDRGAAGLWYGAYTTWSEDETVSWFPFRPMADGTSWGVGYATFVDQQPGPAQLPGPIDHADTAAGGYMQDEPLVGLVGSAAGLSSN
jgi:hypothetical protein